MIVIAGDIGGTKTIIQVIHFKSDNTQYTLIFEKLFCNDQYDSFDILVTEFIRSLLSQHKNIIINRACLAIAGPIRNNNVGQIANVTNLPWIIETTKLRTMLNTKSVTLINDFEAIAHGINLLNVNDTVQLQEGEAAPYANKVVLGAGTGLGICQMIWCNNAYHVQATEGGHCSFAPTDKIQLEFLSYMLNKHKHVSYDQVLSGPGLINIFSFFVDKYEQQPSSAVQHIFTQKDIAQAISNNYKKLKYCQLAVDLFITIYGAQAGNIALLGLAYGGIYLAGGIAPKLLEHLKTPPFLDYFKQKGQMELLLNKMPVNVITNQKVGVLGAATIASRSLSENKDDMAKYTIPE